LSNYHRLQNAQILARISRSVTGFTEEKMTTGQERLAMRPLVAAGNRISGHLVTLRHTVIIFCHDLAPPIVPEARFQRQRVASTRILDSLVSLNRYWYRKSEDALPIAALRSDEITRDCEKSGLAVVRMKIRYFNQSLIDRGCSIGYPA